VPSASSVVATAPSGECGYHGVKSFLTEKGVGFSTAWECALASSEMPVNLAQVPGWLSIYQNCSLQNKKKINCQKYN